MTSNLFDFNRFFLLGLLFCSMHIALGFQREVEINREGATLSGTLMAPDSSYKGVVFLIIAGSGPTDRDGNSSVLPGKNNSLLYLAEDLRDAGFASLRYDKPGLFKSAKGYNPEFLRFSDMTDGAIWWLEYLRAEGFSKIVIIGHSEGALIGKLAAPQRADAVISLAGPGRNALELLKTQLANLDPETKARAFAKLDSLKAGHEVKDDIESLRSIFYSSVQGYLIEWFQYDPCEALQKTQLPALIIQGTEDSQVSEEEGVRLRNCGAALNSQYLLLQYMNHVLKMVEPGDVKANVDAYSNPDLPLHPGLVHGITKFIKGLNW
jgi:pimeloyl-ACP methyl ester carboxylesterase